MSGVKVSEIESYVRRLCMADEYADDARAFNGLQFGDCEAPVGSIACAVDAGIAECRAAAEMGADLLLVHHGLFWDFPFPITGARYEKISLLAGGGVAVMSMHLPLDAHHEIGNNAQIAKALGLKRVGSCGEVAGRGIGALAEVPEGGRSEFADRLKRLFPDTYKAIEFGSDDFRRAAICSGSSGDLVARLREYGVDTLVCGELRQHHYLLAQELKLNLYPCGHYATETFGIKSLCAAVSDKFDIPWQFIPSDNPL